MCTSYVSLDGKPFWVDWGLKLASVAQEQPLIVQLLSLVVFLFLIAPAFVLEKMLGATCAPLFMLIVGGIAGAAFFHRRYKFSAGVIFTKTQQKKEV